MQIITSIISHKAEILGALFFLSEALAYLPGVKANSVFQAIYNFLSQNK